MNSRKAKVFDYDTKEFVPKKWCEIKVGDLMKVHKDENIAADLLLIKSFDNKGLVFVDTMNLDGEVKSD